MHFDPGQTCSSKQLSYCCAISNKQEWRNEEIQKKHDLPGPAGCCAVTALVSVCIFLQINENAIWQEASTNLSGTRVSRFCLGNRSPRHSGRLDRPALRIAPQTLWRSLHSRARREGVRFRDQGEAAWERWSWSSPIPNSLLTLPGANLWSFHSKNKNFKKRKIWKSFHLISAESAEILTLITWVFLMKASYYRLRVHGKGGWNLAPLNLKIKNKILETKTRCWL